MKKTLVANWKMNGSQSLVEDYIQNVDKNIIVCPPSIFIKDLAKHFCVGAQNCALPKSTKALTGEIDAQMLAEVGCTYVIIGHSERRTTFNETTEIVQAKCEDALTHKLTPILCVSDLSQLDGYINIIDKIVVAYEPLTAIGTGQIPDISEIRLCIKSITNIGCKCVLYGGSVTETNAAHIIEHTDGLLIGGASLSAQKIQEILEKTIA